jgi:hypothetical protein
MENENKKQTENTGSINEKLLLSDVSDSKIKDTIKEYLYKYLSNVDYEIRSKYDIGDAIEDGLDDAIKELRKL